MRFKKLIAATFAGAAVAFGAGAASMALTPAVAIADPFEGHGQNCTGLYDGSTCWVEGVGVYQHLDFGEGID
ncbi:hypothetical protein IU436_29400 [Nocardia farcinica]|uniref:hypothetical protein n=1 Tax=Nocardia TaxID=1817 RepID=UPI001895237E|nr:MULTISPECIES: hypothetical protein [Nocardia]MBF6215818.1 hypothetical protein [Nocardia puris]MBF6422710.1 hypothetical protein [Nocardia farcinica]MBF6434440.1 hypothetical protein [Nocardia farcinica]MBF6505525.1 hypothetical protein [Nocardia farcinica]MBF6574149.1 hypothetical protein [Nocardia farcinica]